MVMLLGQLTLFLVVYFCSLLSVQDVCRWIKDKQEVEIVDLFLQIKEKLVCLICPCIVSSHGSSFITLLQFIFVYRLSSL